MNPAVIEKFKPSSKLTEIGEIPMEWGVVRLGDESITLIRGNKTINRFERVAFIPMDFISDSKIFIKYEMRSKNDVKSFTYCERGDLLLAKITPSLENGKQGIVPDSIPNGFALATTEVFPISCKGIDKLFLFYVLKLPKFRNKIISSMIGTTGRQRASKQSVENLQIPLPPLPEQRRIAEVLGTMDSAIQKVGGAIESTERLKKGLMQRLLTKGIGHERFKESEVGRVPEEWKVARLGDVADDFVGGGTPSTTNPDYWNGKIAWMTSSHINGRIVNSGQRLITEKGLKESSTHLIPKDNLLVATRVGIGKAAINSIDVAISQDLTGVIIKKNKANADYIYWFLLTNLHKLKSLAQGSTIKGILKDDLANLKIPLPEQRRIAEILSAVDRKLELERRRKEKLERVKKGLMNELLTGRKRAKIE